MEKRLKLTLMLSLREMALRKVAVLLWKDPDVLALFKRLKYFELYDSTDRKELLALFEDKAFKLKLPKLLQKEMVNMVESIGAEIRRYRLGNPLILVDENERRRFSLKEDCLNVLAKICFNPAGAIDYKKSAAELVRWKELNVIKRYKIACFYCLEDDIPLIWEELPAEMRWIYRSNGSHASDLPFFWPHILKGQISNLDSLLGLPRGNLTSFNQCMFEHSAKTGKKAAAEYFCLKLTQEERDASLMRTAHAVSDGIDSYYEMERFSDVLCYLLSLMTLKQQMEIVKAYPSRVLLLFFHWPMQDLLVENAGIIWPFVDASHYNSLLIDLTYECRGSSFYFLQGLKEFFIQSPLDFKKFFVDEVSDSITTHAFKLFSKIFYSEDSRPFEALFRSLEYPDRVKLIFNTNVLHLFYSDMTRQKWRMVEVCLRLADLTQVDRERLKMRFLGMFERSDDWENEILIRFMEILNIADACAGIEKKAQKRKLENCSSE